MFPSSIALSTMCTMQVKRQGWIPQHVLLYDDTTSELMGCVPLYLKTHSYGEYVFDHSWASTHMRCGLPYYPKLQSCVPFTPVTGNRLLVKPGPNATAVTKALAKGLLELTGMATAPHSRHCIIFATAPCPAVASCSASDTATG
jgi:predicted N-acyltransferase